MQWISYISDHGGPICSALKGTMCEPQIEDGLPQFLLLIEMPLGLTLRLVLGIL